ncbi:MAG: hypothetical protein ABSB96_11150 [Gaiellaceae bacterium]
MEYEITWGGDPEDASVTTWGTATIEGLDAWVKEGLSDSRYRSGMCVLVDHSRLDWSGLTPKDVHERIEFFAKEAARLGRARAAVVMRAPADFGIARMEQAYVELEPELEIEIGVFFSIEDAREWLRERIAADAGSTGS